MPNAFGIEHGEVVEKSDTRTRRLGEATGGLAGGAAVSRAIQAGGVATQRRAYNAARRHPAARGNFTPQKARQLHPYLYTYNGGVRTERLARRGARGLAVGAAGLGVATGASALRHRRGVSKSATVSAFGVEH